jgi:nucleoid-associated protein YgaU
MAAAPIPINSAAGGLTRAILKAKDGPATQLPMAQLELQCQFNPKELSITKAGRWTRTQNAGAESATPPEYRGPDPRNLSMELLLDDWEGTEGQVVKGAETLMSWTNPTPASVQAHAPVAPIISFQWGNKNYFECFVKQVTVKYTMFRSNGMPCRATVGLQLEETADATPATNPTSGGIPGRRSRTVTAGDTLQSIAYREYKDPNFWRPLAAFNGIDDPLRVAVGSTVLIPPRDQLNGSG